MMLSLKRHVHDTRWCHCLATELPLLWQLQLLARRGVEH